MRLKSVLGTLVAFGAMALMAVGVQAATYSAGAVSPEAGVAEVPVLVTPESGETNVDVNGYIIKFTYDTTKVTPKLAADKDASGGDCYATAGEGFNATNSVLVSDIVKTEGNTQTLAVAWASATPVSVNTASTMATVDFDVVEGATGEVPINVELTALTNNGTDVVTATTSDGKITIDAEKFLRGDADGNGVIDERDAALILQVSVNLGAIAEENVLKADANADGVIDERDAALILQYLLGLGTIPD